MPVLYPAREFARVRSERTGATPRVPSIDAVERNEHLSVECEPIFASAGPYTVLDGDFHQGKFDRQPYALAGGSGLQLDLRHKFAGQLQPDLLRLQADFRGWQPPPSLRQSMKIQWPAEFEEVMICSVDNLCTDMT